MRIQWRIVYYETPQGKSPVYDFIEGLNIKTKAKVARTLDLLAQYGTTLGAPHIKKLSGYSLWELRILGTDNVRIMYIAHTGKTFLLLHGFLKKKQQTDQREVKIALNRLEKVCSPGK